MDRNHLLQLRDCIRSSESIEEFKDMVCELIDVLIRDTQPPIDPYRNIYFRNKLDIKGIFYWATEYDDRFEVTSALGEYLVVRKDTGLIIESGYSSTVQDWWEKGFLEQY